MAKEKDSRENNGDRGRAGMLGAAADTQTAARVKSGGRHRDFEKLVSITYCRTINNIRQLVSNYQKEHHWQGI